MLSSTEIFTITPLLSAILSIEAIVYLGNDDARPSWANPDLVQTRVLAADVDVRLFQPSRAAKV